MSPAASFPAERTALNEAQCAAVLARVREPVQAWAERAQLPPAYLEALAPLLVPLVGWLAARRSVAAPGPLLIGLSGAQGTGKSTLAGLLARLFEHGFDLRCAILSLDDLYLTRAERERLARSEHPLLRTRGVPGTHDVALGTRLLRALREAGPGERVRLPRFDKARDDRAPEADWPEPSGPFDCVLFEGWCVGARPEPDAALTTPCNALEREHDPDGRFRRRANEQLAGPYRALFDPLDLLVFLAAPDLQASLAWRIEQEHALAAAGRPAMSDDQVARFVQYFERIARHMLADLPARADVVLRLGHDHGFAAIELR